MRNIDEVNRGIVWAERRLMNNVRTLGEKRAVKYARATAATCSDYAYNQKTPKDKKGKPLTHDRRNFFEGAYMVLSTFLDKCDK
jgi:hypothetical protein